MKRNKYFSKKSLSNGVVFDSRKEAKRYDVLKELEEQGKIKNLQLQAEYELIPRKVVDGKVIERAVKYVADFVYEQEGETIVEDVKGYRHSTAYSLFVVKRKLMLDKFGIKVHEV